MVTIEDIKRIRGITFNRYEEYIGQENTGYPDYKLIKESYYLYHPGDTGEKKSFSYGALSHGEKITKDTDITELLITPDVMIGSDYSGTTIELSNFEVFKERYEDLPGVYTMYGGYSTFAIAISVKWLINPDNEEKAQEIIDDLIALSDYPLLDDEHLSNMESEKEYEWVTGNTNWIWDLNRELKEKRGIEITEFTKDQIWELYRLLSERANEYPIFEDNGYPYIRTEELVKVYRIGDLTNLDIQCEVI